jgi:hypothetical protein
VATFTFEHVSHARDRYNAKRDRTDEQVLADALRTHVPVLRASDPEPVNEAALIAAERADESSWRLMHAEKACEIALGCAWYEAREAASAPGSTLDLAADTVTISITVTDLVATATITIPDLTTPITSKDA